MPQRQTIARIINDPFSTDGDSSNTVITDFDASARNGAILHSVRCEIHLTTSSYATTEANYVAPLFGAIEQMSVSVDSKQAFNVTSAGYIPISGSDTSSANSLGHVVSVSRAMGGSYNFLQSDTTASTAIQYCYFDVPLNIRVNGSVRIDVNMVLDAMDDFVQGEAGQGTIASTMRFSLVWVDSADVSPKSVMAARHIDALAAGGTSTESFRIPQGHLGKKLVIIPLEDGGTDYLPTALDTGEVSIRDGTGNVLNQVRGIQLGLQTASNHGSLSWDTAATALRGSSVVYTNSNVYEIDLAGVTGAFDVELTNGATQCDYFYYVTTYEPINGSSGPAATQVERVKSDSASKQANI